MAGPGLGTACLASGTETLTDSAGPGPQAQREARPSYRAMARAVLRAAGSTAALVAVYYLLPLDRSSTWAAATMLVIGMAAFIALVGFQVRWITRSPFPGLRAIEALATSVPLFVLLFAGAYVVMAAVSASNFGEKLTHTDGLYFAVTVFSTVGFGDVTAKTQEARLVVTGQLGAVLIILGLGARIILGAVTRARQRETEDRGADRGPR